MKRAKRHGQLLIAATAFCVALLPKLTLAAVCTVTTPVDNASQPPTGSLRACIDFANQTPGADQIVFDPAAFSPGIITPSGALPSLSDPAGVTIDGASAQNVIIDGALLNGLAGIDVTSSDNQLRNLTIRNLDGSGWGSGTAIYLHAGARRTVMSGLVLADNVGGGVLVEGDNGGTVLESSEIHGSGWAGIRTTNNQGACDGRIVIRGNHFHDNDLGPTVDDVMLSFTPCVDVLNNRFERNNYFGLRIVTAEGTGINVTGNTFTASSLGIFGGARGNSIAFNRFDAAPQDAITVGDAQGSNDNVIVGNVIRGAVRMGINIYPAANDTLIAHNTFYANGEAAIAAFGSTGLRIHNNLFVNNNKGLQAADEPTWQVSHNGYFQNTNGDCFGGCTGGTQPIAGDPGFLGPPDDFRLTGCGAGAVDKGLDLGTLQPDLTGRDDARMFNGAAPDLGAFESDCGAPGSGGTDGGAAAADGGVLSRDTPWDLGVGCGCAAGGSGAAGWLIVLAALALWRRGSEFSGP